MQRPPPACCRRAVHSLNPPASLYIWIPDHLLAAAFLRLSRTSHFHQKRHGSNVPGPLEARRRLAKRRMTGVASQYAGGPPLSGPFDFGALFGFLSKSKRQPAWRYEPPSQPQWLVPPDPPLLQADGSCEAATSAALNPRTPRDTSQVPPPAASSVAKLEANLSQAIERRDAENLQREFANDGATSALDPNACWSHFKTALQAAAQLPSEERQQFVQEAFQRLCPTVDVEGIFLYQFLQWMRGTEEQVHNIPSLVHRVFLEPALPVPSLGTNGALVLLHELERWPESSRWGGQWYTRWISAILEQVAEGADRPSAFLPVLYRQVWEAALDPHDETIPSKLVHRLWDAFEIEEIRHILYTIADLDSNDAVCLAHVDHDHLSQVLGYVPAAIRSPLVSRLLVAWAKAGIPPSAVHHRLYRHRILDLLRLLPWVEFQLAQSKCPQPVQTQLIQDFCNIAQVKQYPSLNGPRSRHMSIASFLNILHTSNIPNAGMADMFFDLVHQHEGPKAVFGIMVRLRDKKAQLSDASILHKYLNLTQSVNKELGFTIGFCRIAAALETPSTTSSGEGSFGRLAIEEFSSILDQATKSGVLPLIFRDRHISGLMPFRKFLIKQIAYQYSIDRSLSAMQLWRRCDSLYLYCVRHQVSMDSFLVDTLVECTLWRPMADKRHVPRLQAWRMVRLVSQVKGEAAGRALQAVFDERRGKLVHYAQHVHRGLGGKGKPHVNTLKKLGLA
ncbi:hypothetical protein P154DRAFT_479320 [Amniculicola lignicola CBS 123094]|uniref:Uncharacterized protein n=1 Tax=Amniculicola lignicola CBS 123094 TaxID=1392246 RepID=A0A6A5X4S0_9PLEO|nr:hypothetical protein P154DRAFT_479320 [Amniculicola lignicola CBS 123094]